MLAAALAGALAYPWLRATAQGRQQRALSAADTASQLPAQPEHALDLRLTLAPPTRQAGHRWGLPYVGRMGQGLAKNVVVLS